MIQKCKKCSCQFTRKKILKSIFFSWGYHYIECEECNTKHYVDFKTRLFISLGIAIPIFLIPFFARGRNTFNIPTGVYYALIYIFCSALLIGLTPFFARYHIKK